MLADLKGRFEAIEAQKETILARVGAREDVQRRMRPRADEWSLLEVVHHLMLAEEQMAQGMDAALSKPPERRFRGLFVPMAVGALRLGIRFPPPASMEPRGDVSFEEAAQRWHTAREVVRARLEAVEGQHLRAPVVQHPLAGPLDAREVLSLTEAHLYYHLRQIERLCGPAGLFVARR